ncbi:tetratricopeptide repeat protein [Kovacikia minuta CCNUW1]|uniref:tetratricopeptide repeat protein n=1 Tax=Kovacikia minuta TaxID=2931930 RepID=UPI001CCA223A|nr:tetratricopeptide repeat protein [Kovacikia minuta]UBF25693.1 tetratricopeptide repeat protein [Kovacikia minuta CCNUW1]
MSTIQLMGNQESGVKMKQASDSWLLASGSSQSIPIQEIEQLQDSGTELTNSPIAGWVILLCLAAIVGGQIVYQRSRKPSSPDPNSTANSSVGEAGIHQDSGKLHFTQALQWVSYAKELERSQQYEAAVAVFDQGLRHHPQDFRLWHERGLVLAKLQRFEDAIQSYDRAYQLRPHDRDLAHERGDTLLELERYEEAIAAFNTYLQRAPGNPHILTDQGYALYHLKRYEEALEMFNQVLKSAERDRDSRIRAHYYQIESLRQLGQLDAALLSSQQAIKQYPEEFFKVQHEELQQQISIANNDI